MGGRGRERGIEQGGEGQAGQGDGADLSQEIAILRQMICQVMELLEDEHDLTRLVKGLNAIGMAAMRIARLLEASRKAGGGLSDLEKAFNEVLEELHERFEKDRKPPEEGS
jgi:hypothetical protein